MKRRGMPIPLLPSRQAQPNSTPAPAPLPPVDEWAEREFWIPERAGPIRLYPYQRAVLKEARRRDEHGNFVYSLVLWGDIKKSAKSTIAAALALHVALETKWASVHVVANDLKQAQSRVGEFLVRAINNSPALTEKCKVIPSRNRVEVAATGGVIEFVPIDPKGEAGGNDDLIIFSELWGAHEKAMLQMWAEMTLSPTKFGKSQRWIETYAGYEGESELLYGLYEQGVKHGRRLTLTADDGTPLNDLEVYANDAARMLCLWNGQARLPWQTPAYYAQERASLEPIPGAFERMHLNQWVSGVDAFVDMALWDALKVQVPALDKTTPIVLGVDAAETDDCFGIVAVSRVPGRDKTVAVRYVRKWTPPPGGKISFRGTPENPGPLTVLEQLIAEYNVVCLAYDKTQLELAAQDLTGKVWLYQFSQAGERETADNMLRDLALNRRILHDGNPDLREHIANANAQATGKDKRGIRIVKRGSGKIDLAVATSMAANRCLSINL